MATWIDRIRSLWVWGQWQPEPTIHQLPALPRQSCSALSRNLKRLREARGWSIPLLAAKSAVSASTIRLMEIGNNYDVPEADRRYKRPTYDPNPTLVTLLALALALNVTLNDLVEDRNYDK